MIVQRKYRKLGYPGLGLRGLRGLAGCEPENCGDASSVSEQWACVQRNEAKQDPVTGQYCTPTSTGWAPTPDNGYILLNNPVQGGVLHGPNEVVVPQTPVVPITQSTAFTPRVTFQNSRGGNILYPGDTWTISITGGRPGGTVQVMGGKNGATDVTRMGVADSSGNFTLSGTITAVDIGSWSEQWSVSGVTAIGGFSFAVQPTPSQQTTVPPVQSPNATGPAPTNNSTQTPTVGFSLSDIPWYIYAGAGALFFFGSKR